MLYYLLSLHRLLNNYLFAHKYLGNEATYSCDMVEAKLVSGFFKSVQGYHRREFKCPRCKRLKEDCLSAVCVNCTEKMESGLNAAAKGAKTTFDALKDIGRQHELQSLGDLMGYYSAFVK